MISLVEALNYRCLQYISQHLGSFHNPVCPNASGKTTFLDVISFLSQLVSIGLEDAVNERTRNFKDLLWMGTGDRFELAIEANIPESVAKKFIETRKPFDTIRYEVSIGLVKETNQTSILEERVLLKIAKITEPIQRILFPMIPEFSPSLISKGSKNILTVVKKVRGGNDYFQTELLQEKRKGWQYAFKLGTQKSALGNLPADETQFPATTWLRNLLVVGVQSIVLNSLLIRKASPPGQGRGFRPDGSNLPWVIDDLLKKNPSRFNDWIAHLRTALPDIEGIRTIEREDDRHRYLVVKYVGGLEIPSWVVSDGTLRLLALTLPAYLPDLK